MRKLIAAMKVSLDQKFVGPEGFADWVDGWSEDYGLTPQIDACILGGHMFAGYEQYWTAIQNEPHKPLPMTETAPTPGEVAWAKSIPQIPHYVLSKTPGSSAWPNVKYLTNAEDVRALKRQPGKDIYLMGGGETVTSLIDAGLVDELRLIVYPLIAGGTGALFSSSERRLAAKLKDARSLEDGRLSLIYRFE